MKRKIFKQFLATTLLTTILLLTDAGISNAALQANPNTQYKKTYTPANWMSNFRKMEEAGGVMGLSEKLDSDLTASSDSNNIDIHMVKTTEYGAVAILSASGYGNPNNDKVIKTTTGNNTGVILNTSYYEWTAGGFVDNIFSGINGRYFDTYNKSDSSNPETDYPARVGDALGKATSINPGCFKWHSAGASWVSSTSTSYAYFARGNGGIFAYTSDIHNGSLTAYSRGVVVCGEGL